jgi:hypothetical protein
MVAVTQKGMPRCHTRHPHPELQGKEDDALRLSENMQLTGSAGKAG